MAMLKLIPACKEYLWGGNKLIKEYNKSFAGETLAETWELSCHDDGPSVIAEGKFAGKTLKEYIDIQGKEVLGSYCKRFNEFPVLIKFIDAKDNLSIQVHPDNSYALKHEGQYGKTEMWYVADCKEGAFLYYGFCREIDKEEFLRRIQDNTLLEVLNQVPVKKGDVLFIEAGTIHAIGKDIVIAEIQQNSNVTYRVYDYGRVGKDGKLRDLHIEKALAVTNRVPILRGKSYDPHIADCDYFTVDKLTMDGKMMKKMSGYIGKESFVSFLFLEGSGLIQSREEKISFEKGDSVFVCAGSGEYEITGTCEALVTSIGPKKSPLRIGIDLGGTEIKAGIVNQDNQIIASDRCPTKVKRNVDEIVQDMGEMVLELLEKNDISLDSCIGVGIGSPGTIEQKKGTVLYSNNFNWENIRLEEKIKTYIPLPVTVGNDASCAAFGEVITGAAKGCRNVVLLTLGTGVGGGIILDGKIFEGGFAGGGEIGHSVIAAGGETCSCGRKGCMEAYISVPALIREAKKKAEANHHSLLYQMCEGDLEKMNAKIPFDAADAGDKEAKEVIDQYMQWLGISVLNVVNIFRPEKVLIGGGISNRGDRLIKDLNQQIAGLAFAGNYTYIPEVAIAQLGNEAGIIGAAGLVDNVMELDYAIQK